MRLNYQKLIARLSEIILANPDINSVGVGRELEFDVKKSNLWPRGFIRTDGAGIIGGPGSADLTVSLAVLIADRLTTDRSNMQAVLNSTFSSMIAFIATANKEEIIRIEDNLTILPLYDYQDAQAAGWQVEFTCYLFMPFECYPVP